MFNGAHHFAMPPRLTNERGALRTCGVEVEFGGLDVAEAAALVQRVYGGDIVELNRFSTVVRGARFGDWGVEIDSKLLTQQRYKELLHRLGVSERLTHVVEDVIELVARRWIPSEIVSPPLVITDLPETEAVRQALFEQHADGTGASLLYSFGLQFNPEIPALDAATITRYLRAFMALYDWLVAVADIDFKRRLSSFIDPFPREYRLLVLVPAYAPTMEELIDDYLLWNPTRNRVLDMLPAFRHIAAERVMLRAEEPHKIKARPTFHYRLPDSRVDDPGWSFALEWNRWVEVECLAEDPERLRGLSAEIVAREGDPVKGAELADLADRWGLDAQ